MRKLFSLFVALLATTSLWAHDFEVDGIYYNFLEANFLGGNNVEVTYKGSSYNDYSYDYSDAVTIPETVTYNGTTYSVKSIGEYAFYYCRSLTSVTIGNYVTSIGSRAFEDCTSLTSVTIGNSVKNIGEYAFYRCESLTSITIPNSVTSIGEYAFKDCSQLTSVTIGNSVKSIGDDAFYKCSKLKSVTINSDAIVSKAYSSNSNISHIFGSQVTKYIIGKGVTSIGENAFSYGGKLTSVTMSNSVTSIGNNAFSGCSKLTSITIPNSVTSIGYRAFRDCSSLTTPVYNAHCFAYLPTSFKGAYVIPEGIKQIAGGAFYDCSSLTSITIPNSVTSIGDDAFRGCTSLTSVTIGNSVTSIGYRAFKDCSKLTSVTIGNSVTSIGGDAFEYCSSLTSITIPNSVTSIEYRAFKGCSSLTSVTIGNSVTSIGDYAFEDCSSLTSITCEATTPPTLGNWVFRNVSKSIPVYVPCECVNAYKNARYWYDFTNIQGPLAEHSIQVSTSNSQMGTAKVDYNTLCGAQISATANDRYHFVQWSDGNTDNPRTIVLTQDTTLTAEFAPNQYSITTNSKDPERGTTQGDTTVNYLENVTISATANYGYHFVQWNDGDTTNPRQVQVTENKTYTAEFEKNTYSISLTCNKEQGQVEGPTFAEYLDEVTISATANCGYHFVQWSDGVTDNPRTLVLTQDTVLTAEFAQSFSGQCGDNLYWSYDETAKTISITGSGEMYDYTATTQPWLLFKEQIVEVTINNTVTSIGTSAFEGCVRLAKISLGTGLEEIAANAFAGCIRLYDIYVYATYPPFAEESSFANYNVYVYVPCENQRSYILDIVWGKFRFIECIESEETTTDGNVTVIPGTNDVTITWPTEGNADTYTIIIKKGNEVFCTLTFNAEGQLLNIAFAPGRNGNHPAQYAEQAGKGYRFTVTNLESGTKYGYNIDVKDASNKTIKSHSGKFTTESLTAVENTHIQSPTSNCQKILRNGQLIILRDGVEYNAMGQEL